jgi:hypothetical protein
MEHSNFLVCLVNFENLGVICIRWLSYLHQYRVSEFFESLCYFGLFVIQLVDQHLVCIFTIVDDGE